MSDDKNANPKPQTSQFPIDLATTSKVQLVKQTDAKGQTTTQPTYRALNQPMRVLTMPATGVPPSGTQIIQTHIVPPSAILKASPGGLQNRSISSAITVTKAPTYHIAQRTGSITSIGGAKNSITPIRTPTPPASGTVQSGFVRTTTMTPRTSSPTTTVSVLSPGTGTTWVGGTAALQVQLPTQFLKSNLPQNRATRIFQSLQTAGTNNAGQTITNIYGTQASNPTINTVNPTISVSTTTSATGQQQYVATVLPRNQATLVYTNPNSQQQQFIAGQQRLGVVSTATQRQVRPMQRISSNIRVTSNAISIRTPILTPTSVLSTLPQSIQNRATTVQASSTQFANSMPTRIIQVQSQPASGTSAGTITAGGNTGTTTQVNQKLISNMMLPILVNNNRITGHKPSLAFAHVSKLPATAVSAASGSTGGTSSPANDGNSMSATTSVPSTASPLVGTAIQQVTSSTQTHGNNSGTINNQSGTTFSQPTTQIIVSQQQLQHQQQQQSIAATVFPLTITSRVNTIPIKTISMSGENRTITTNTSNSGATILPITKIISQSQPNQQQNENQGSIGAHSITPSHQGPVYIHTRAVNSPAASTVSSANTGSHGVNGSANTNAPNTIFSNSGTVYYEQVTTTTTASSPITVSSSSDNKSTVSSIQFTQPSGSFAVVSTTRQISHVQNMLSNNPGNSLSPTVRFNVAESSSNSSQQQTQQQQQQQQNASHALITMGGPMGSAGQIAAQHNESPTHMIIQRNISAKSDSTGPTVSGPSIKIKSKFPGQTPIRTTSISRNLISQMLTMPRSQTPPTMQQQSQQVPTQLSQPLTLQQIQAIPTAESTNDPKKYTQNAEDIHNLMRIFSPRSHDSTPHTETMSESVERRYSSDGSTTISAPNSPSMDDIDDDEMDNGMFVGRLQNESAAILAKSSNKPYKYNVMIQQQKQGHDGDKKGQNYSMHSYQEPSTSAGPSGIKHHCDYRNMDDTPKKKLKKTNVSGKPDGVGEEGAVAMNDGNNENMNAPKEFVFKRPKTMTLLQSYKPTWKAAHNHFTRWSDVRPREERKPTAVDIANQPNIAQRIKGWKVMHFNGQLEEIVENEQEVYNQLDNILKEFMESADQMCPETERTIDLLKGNIQRIKLIIENTTDAKTQINKVYDYQDHATELINRYASKRNFKKRDKN